MTIDPARWYPVAASDDLPYGHVYQTMLGGDHLAIWRASDGRRRVSALFLVGVLLSSLLNAVSCQKYYDALILLFLVWRVDGEPARDPWRRRCLCALILIFCVYTATFPLLTRSRGVVMQAPALPP